MATLQSSPVQISFRPPLRVGDIAPDCVLPDLDGAIVDLRSDAIAGNPIALIFCPKFAPAVTVALAGYRSRLQAMAAAGARLFAVTLEQSKAAAGQNIPFPVLRDGKGKVFRAFMPQRAIIRPRSCCDPTTTSPQSSNRRRQFRRAMRSLSSNVSPRSASRS
jgi:hypothetical protein